MRTLLRIPRVIAAIGVFTALVVVGTTVQAEKIKVVFKKPNWNTLDDKKDNDAPPAANPVPPKGSTREENKDNKQIGKGNVDCNCFKEVPWSSNGWPRGGMHKNDSGKTITKIVITVEAPDEFDEASKTDSDFGTATLSADKRTLTFDNVNVKPCEYFWSQVPWSNGTDKARRSTDTAQKGTYKGQAHEEVPKPPKPEEKKEPDKKADGAGDKKSDEGIDGENSNSFFDGEHINFSFAPVQFVRFGQGTILQSPASYEDIIGAQINLPSLSIIGPSDQLPGAWRLSESYFGIIKGDAFFVTGNITNVLLIPDNTVPGYDSVIQGELVFTYASGPIRSRFVSRMTNDVEHQRELHFFMRTNLISATGNFAFQGSSPVEYICNVSLPPITCPGDTNGDHVVNNVDFLEVFQAFKEGITCDGCIVDLDGDGVVTFFDVLLLRQLWGPCPEESDE